MLSERRIGSEFATHFPCVSGCVAKWVSSQSFGSATSRSSATSSVCGPVILEKFRPKIGNCVDKNGHNSKIYSIESLSAKIGKTSSRIGHEPPQNMNIKSLHPRNVEGTSSSSFPQGQIASATVESNKTTLLAKKWQQFDVFQCVSLYHYYSLLFITCLSNN